jgi:poly-gamma-glutamate capsule biosynthesis protein CapA/YwtB (metallophosphatase superfamily)
MLLDRGVYQTIKVQGNGVDFPFDGGTAEITGHTCCSQFGWRVPKMRRTGDKGAVRELMTKADLAIANLENPAPNRFKWHTSGVVFSADPSILKGLKRAGIDWVSLANNHIGDAGRNGIIQTMRNLDKAGIAYSGAGRNLDEARSPAILEANGVKVAILAYDKVAKYYHAGEDRTGSAPLETKYVKKDIKLARAAGADVVIVFPHWGVEYDPTPFANQQKQARAIIEGGADMIIGNHAHWAAALEIHEGKPIWYALGNFVFDQVWSEPTMEGITLELTFHGKELVQAKMRPHIILDKAQPNFLDPAGDGKVVMGQVYDASKGILPW